MFFQGSKITGIVIQDLDGVSFCRLVDSTGLNLKQVKHLDLRGCAITFGDLEYIKRCSSLQSLLLPEIHDLKFMDVLFGNPNDLVYLELFMPGRSLISKEFAYLKNRRFHIKRIDAVMCFFLPSMFKNGVVFKKQEACSERT